MRRFLLLIFIISLSTTGFSQYSMDWGIHIGASNYLGDIGGTDGPRRDFIYDVKLNQTRYVFGGHLRYKLNRSWSVSANFLFGRVEGKDEETDYAPRRARNLNFRNNIKELALRGELTLYSDNDVGGRGYYNPDFKLFGFAGVAGIMHNPQGYLNEATLNHAEGWYDLRPLTTEAQSEEYSQFALAFPMGLGVYFTHDRTYRFGWEIGYRLAMTDYLDDISNVYAFEDELPNELSRALANQTTPEVIQETFGEASQIYNYHYPDNFEITNGRNQRGVNDNNDGYIFSTFSFGMLIREKSRFSRSSKYNWFNERKRRKKKARAKF
ncbi:MAG: hypothetical protein HKN45_01145 [Flavobacteriales bacterium]|nr:hypothetical protein [Flavobacteriales bacterium]